MAWVWVYRFDEQKFDWLVEIWTKNIQFSDNDTLLSRRPPLMTLQQTTTIAGVYLLLCLVRIICSRFVVGCGAADQHYANSNRTLENVEYNHMDTSPRNIKDLCKSVALQYGSVVDVMSIIIANYNYTILMSHF